MHAQDDAQSHSISLGIHAQTISWETWYKAVCDALKERGAPSLNSIEKAILKQKYGEHQRKANQTQRKTTIKLRINILHDH